jgi:D-xylose transport system ATP-binding protein
MEEVRAIADRIVVLRLGENNGVFTPKTSNEELIGAITGAKDNSVSRRAAEKNKVSHESENGEKYVQQ